MSVWTSFHPDQTQSTIPKYQTEIAGHVELPVEVDGNKSHSKLMKTVRPLLDLSNLITVSTVLPISSW